jgi:DNA-binding beta-propeller fold protein YncE
MIGIRTRKLALLTVLFAVAGCGGLGKADLLAVWPAPPAEPIIAYQESLYGSHNLPRGFFGRITDFLFGRSTDYDIAKPYGIAYDGKSKLYIADTAKKAIIILDLGSGKARLLTSIEPYGKLIEPVNIVLDRENNIYVADTKLARIAVFDRELKFSHFIGAEGQLANPVGMAIGNENDRIYVVDSNKHQVKIFSLDGDLLGEIGRRGDQQGEFHYPLGIAVNRGDTIYVVDSFHFAVQAFDMDGDYLFSFGPGLKGIGHMARPRCIAIDSGGNIFVTDALNHNVQIYDSGGNLILKFGGLGFGPGGFRLPAGINITDNNIIYVADSINKRIQIFRLLKKGDYQRS